MKKKLIPTGNLTSKGLLELRLGFCPTGSGGGVDNSCGNKGSGGGAQNPGGARHEKGKHVPPTKEHVDRLKAFRKDLKEKLSAGKSTADAKQKPSGKAAGKASDVAHKASFAAKQAKGPDAKVFAHSKAAVAHNAAAGFHRAIGNAPEAARHEKFAAQHRKEVAKLNKDMKIKEGAKRGTSPASAKGTAKTAYRASAKAKELENKGDKRGADKMHAHAALKHLVAANKFMRLGDKAKESEHRAAADVHKKKLYG